ncbi:MAG: hypothetical protein KDA79_22590, partial [Planctomycetaceae bacterium]|nr:hypothetical protein [Planctomycetaceae bacterium]
MARRQPLDVRSAVAEALRYYRYRGASLSSIDAYAGIRTDSRNYRSERKSALQQLSSEDYAEKRGTLWFLQPIAFRAARGDAYAP